MKGTDKIEITVEEMFNIFCDKKLALAMLIADENDIEHLKSVFLEAYERYILEHQK